jgi:hypothetical protein
MKPNVSCVQLIPFGASEQHVGLRRNVDCRFAIVAPGWETITFIMAYHSWCLSRFKEPSMSKGKRRVGKVHRGCNQNGHTANTPKGIFVTLEFCKF